MVFILGGHVPSKKMQEGWQWVGGLPMASVPAHGLSFAGQAPPAPLTAHPNLFPPHHMSVFLEIPSICSAFTGTGSSAGSGLWCLVPEWEFERNEVWWHLVPSGPPPISCSNRPAASPAGVLPWIKQEKGACGRHQQGPWENATTHLCSGKA